jgi:hypothetical protein
MNDSRMVEKRWLAYWLYFGTKNTLPTGSMSIAWRISFEFWPLRDTLLVALLWAFMSLYGY